MVYVVTVKRERKMFNYGKMGLYSMWLYENCYNKYCVINPKTKAYIKVGGKKNVIPQAIKAANRWSTEK